MVLYDLYSSAAQTLLIIYHIPDRGLTLRSRYLQVEREGKLRIKLGLEMVILVKDRIIYFLWDD